MDKCFHLQNSQKSVIVNNLLDFTVEVPVLICFVFFFIPLTFFNKIKSSRYGKKNQKQRVLSLPLRHWHFHSYNILLVT